MGKKKNAKIGQLAIFLSVVGVILSAITLAFHQHDHKKLTLITVSIALSMLTGISLTWKRGAQLGLIFGSISLVSGILAIS